jgi:hypothetical protein
MKADIKTFDVSDFKAYQDIILSISVDKFVLFRGQSQDKPLLPKIARYNLEDVASTEKAMLEEFKRRSLHLIHCNPHNEWDWMALAQHHGMATRLLDWTENPLIAMWFSITSGDDQNSDFAIVWGFDVPTEDVIQSDAARDPFQKGSTKVFKPNHIIQRITAQFGWFTIHKLNEEKKFTPFEENPEYSDRLFKIRIHARAFSECRKRLHNFGISWATMYPDIDGLAKHVEWLFLNKPIP